MVEAHHHSAEHQQGSFHKTENCQTVLKYAVPNFGDKLLFVSFQQICFAFRILTENTEN